MDVSPVLVVFQAFPEHRHDLIAGHHVIGQVGDVGHLSAGRAPRVVGRRLSDLHKKQSHRADGVERSHGETYSGGGVIDGLAAVQHVLLEGITFHQATKKVVSHQFCWGDIDRVRSDLHFSKK